MVLGTLHKSYVPVRLIPVAMLFANPSTFRLQWHLPPRWRRFVEVWRLQKIALIASRRCRAPHELSYLKKTEKNQHLHTWVAKECKRCIYIYNKSNRRDLRFRSKTELIGLSPSWNRKAESLQDSFPEKWLFSFWVKNPFPSDSSSFSGRYFCCEKRWSKS